MPRKKRKAGDGTGKAVESSPQHVAMNSSAPPPPPQAWHQPAGAAHQAAHQAAPSRKQEEDAKMKELRYLQEMFAKKLDPVVVHMIMEDCEYKVDAALETLFKLAEDGQPGEEDIMSFKNVYPAHESSLDQQEAWGAAISGSSRASTALPEITTSRNVFAGLDSTQATAHNSEDAYPPLPSRSLDASHNMHPGIASQNRTVNGYHSSSENVLPNTPSTMNSAPRAAEILVDNSMFDFEISSDSTSGARPKSNGNLESSIPGQNTIGEEHGMSTTGSVEYFRLPLPGESVANYDFNFSDNLVSSSDMNPVSMTQEQLTPDSSTLKVQKRRPSEMPLEQADDSSLMSENSNIDDRLEREAQIERLQQEPPEIKLFQGQQLTFPEMDSPGGGILFQDDGSLDVMLDEDIETVNDSELPAISHQSLSDRALHTDVSVSNEIASELLSGREVVSLMDPDDNFAVQIEQELSLGTNQPQELSLGPNQPQELSLGPNQPQELSLGPNQPQTLSLGPKQPQQTSAESHIMTNEDDDLISEIVDSDDDLALAIEEELAEILPEQVSDPPAAAAAAPPTLDWQSSLTENEEWDNLMKEIDASADKIHTEPIAQSVQEFILENTPSAAVNKWFSPVSDSVDDSNKPFFPEYRLFPSLSSADNILDISQASSDDNKDDIKMPITSKVTDITSKVTDITDTASNNKESLLSGDESKQTTENRIKENTSLLPERNTPQLPVIKAELSIEAEEFVPRPVPNPQDPPVTDASEKPKFETPLQPITRPRMVYSSRPDATSGTPPPRMPFQPPGRHPTGAPPQMPFQPAFSGPGLAPPPGPGPYRIVGSIPMPAVTVGRMAPGMPPFQGRAIRPVPHMLPPGTRMPMPPPGPRPGGPMPPPGPIPGGPMPPPGPPPGGPMPPPGPRPGGPMPPPGPRPGGPMLPPSSRPGGPMPPPGPRPSGVMPPPGPRPGGPMPQGPPPVGPMSPMGFPSRPPGNHPAMPMQSRNHGPHFPPRMPGPGPQTRMVGLGSQPPLYPGSGPVPSMQPRFAGPGSPQHRPPATVPFRHPSVTSVGPPQPVAPGTPPPHLSRPNSVSSPPILQPPHRPGLVGAPRWPLIESKVVRRSSDVPEVKDEVKPLPSDKKVMCLMRGCPGSGKSTVARQLKGEKGVVYSTDDFFTVHGDYKFDPRYLSEAHNWNQNKAQEACEAGTSPIIIDNTNTQLWEMKPYVAMAIKNGYQVEFREPTTPWKNKPSQLAKKNSHGVPVDILEKMVERYEHDVTVKSKMNLPDRKMKRKAKKDEEGKKEIKENKGLGHDKKTENVALHRNSGGQSLEGSIKEGLITPNIAQPQMSALIVDFKEVKTQPVHDDDQETFDKSLTEESSSEEKSESDIVLEESDESSKVVSPPSSCKKAVLQLSVPLEIFKPTSADAKDKKEEVLTKSGSQEVEKGVGGKKYKESDDCEDSRLDEKESGHSNKGVSDDEDRKLDKEISKPSNEDIGLFQMSKPLVQSVESTSGKVTTWTPDKNDSLILSVNTDIAASCKFQLEDSVKTNQIQETIADQLRSCSTIKESEYKVINTDSKDIVKKEATHCSVEQVASEMPNSCDTSTDRPVTEIPNNVHPDNFNSLQKARQYAIEITKAQSGKYVDAPCSQCADQIETNFTDLNDQNLISLEVANSISGSVPDTSTDKLHEPVTCNSVQEAIMTYTDAEELDSCDIVLLDTDPEFCDSVEAPLAEMESAAVDDSGTINLVSEKMAKEEEEEEEGEEDQLEDVFLVTNQHGDVKDIDTTSSLNPDQNLSDLKNENMVTVDNDSENKFIPVAPEGTRAKNNQRHSPHTPRLAAVFSEALANPCEIKEPQEEKMNWIFPSFTDSQSNGAKQELYMSSNTTKLTESSSQTMQEEFAIVQKLESGKLSKTEVCEMGFNVLVGHADLFLNYIINQIADLSSNDKANYDIPTIRKLDQSTMTEDETRERGLSSNLLTLQSCFPNVPLDSLQGVLDDCLGDVEWATNILIDSGYTDSTPSTHVSEECFVQESVEEKLTNAASNQDKTVKETGTAEVSVGRKIPEDSGMSLPTDTSAGKTIPEESVTISQTSQNTNTQIQPNTESDINDEKPDLLNDTSTGSTGIDISIGLEESCEKAKDDENVAQELSRTHQNDHCEDSEPHELEAKSVAVSKLDSSARLSIQDSNSSEEIGPNFSNPDSNFIPKANIKSETNIPSDFVPTYTDAALKSKRIKEESTSIDNLVVTQENISQLKDHCKDSELIEPHVSSREGESVVSESIEKCDDSRSSGNVTSSQGSGVVLNEQIIHDVATDKPIHNPLSGKEQHIDGKIDEVSCSDENGVQSGNLDQNEGHSGHCDHEVEISEHVMQKLIQYNSKQQEPTNTTQSHDKEPIKCGPEQMKKAQDDPGSKMTTSPPPPPGGNLQGPVSDNTLTVPMELLVPLSSATPKAALSTKAKPESNVSAFSDGCNISSKQMSGDVISSHSSTKEGQPSEKSTDLPSVSNPSASPKNLENVDEKHLSGTLDGMATTPDDEPPKVSYSSSSIESSPKSRGSSEAFSDDDFPVASRRDLLGLDDGMVLQLDTAFVLQLQEMFGPVGFHLSPDGLSDKDLEVKLSHRIARELHTLWAATLHERFDEEQEQMERMINADEQLARKLQQEEEMKLMQEQEKSKKQSQLNKKTAKDGTHPSMKLRKLRPLLVGPRLNLPLTSAAYKEEPVGACAPWWKELGPEEQRQLQDIMDEEVARQIHESDEASNSAPEDSEGKVHTLAAKIKRKQLYEQFPTIDKSLLDDIFAKHNYEVTPTIRDVEKLLSNLPPPRDVYTEEELMRLEKKQMEQAEKESLAEMQQFDENPDSSPEYETASTSYQSFDNPRYHDFRAEATLHYQQRQECFQKAAAAYQRGLKDLASFYSRQGHKHTELLKAAHKRASDAILEARHAELDENILDLHGLHVEEAVVILEEVLKERNSQSNTSSDIPPLTHRPSHLLIITGRGKNSRGGVARIKPAVATYLKNHNYRFTIPNAGLIKVLW